MNILNRESAKQWKISECCVHRTCKRKEEVSSRAENVAEDHDSTTEPDEQDILVIYFMKSLPHFSADYSRVSIQHW